MKSRIGKYCSSMVGVRDRAGPSRQRGRDARSHRIHRNRRTRSTRPAAVTAHCLCAAHRCAPMRGDSFWCRRGDSNSHGFRHCPLKTACLPISPRRRCASLRYRHRRRIHGPAPAPHTVCRLFRHFTWHFADFGPPAAAPAGAGAGAGARRPGADPPEPPAACRRPPAAPARPTPSARAALSMTPCSITLFAPAVRGAEPGEPEARQEEHRREDRRSCATGNWPTRRRRRGCPTRRCRTPRPCPRPCRAAAARSRIRATATSRCSTSNNVSSMFIRHSCRRPGLRSAARVIRPPRAASPVQARAIAKNSAGLQRRAADQPAVDVRHREQRRRVVRLDAAAVQQRDVRRACRRQPRAQRRVHRLRLLRRGRPPGADRPHRLVGDDQPRRRIRPPRRAPHRAAAAPPLPSRRPRARRASRRRRRSASSPPPAPPRAFAATTRSVSP